MKLIIKQVCKPSLGVSLVIRSLYRNKNIEIYKDPNVLTDFLQINKSNEKIYGNISILRYLQGTNLTNKQFDLQWNILYNTEIQNDQPYQLYTYKMINTILSQQQFIHGEKIGESDIIAFTSIDNISHFESQQKFKNLVQWYHNVQKILLPQLKQIHSDLDIEYKEKSQQNNNLSTQFVDYSQRAQVKLDSIVPDAEEKVLFDFLKQFIKDTNQDVVIRVSGGWVRDKLLGKQSHDIDIALDNQMGEQFVTKLKAYSETKGEEIGHVGVIKANPDQSKHLETATCRVKGFDIDFVNLRGEEYAENSRIPTISFGTPQQDAERRDLTMNSMFYNVNEDKIEDFCQRGFEDLKQGLCMTPLEPLKTFLDDPLRILRTFRFASRYQYLIDESLIQAINKPEVKKALFEKISRERVRTEFEKMLRSKYPMSAVNMIYRNNLWDCIYQIHSVQKELSTNEKLKNETEQISYKFVEIMDKDFKNFESSVKQMENYKADLQFLYYICSSLFPYHKYTNLNPKKKIQPFSQHLAEISLKLGKTETDNLIKICESASQFQHLVQIQEKKEELFIELVKLIRYSKELWEMGFFLAKQFDTKYSKKEELVSKYENLLQYIQQNHLNTVFQEKPLLNGQEIQQYYGKGKIVGIVGKNVLFWQFKNHGKSKEDLIQIIKEDLEKSKEQQLFIQDINI